MLSNVLPARISSILNRKLNPDRLYEIRLRAGRAVTVNYGGTFYFLSTDGLSTHETDGIVLPASVLNDVIVSAADYSLYTANRNICNGFITIDGGIRIGIAGECVWEDSQIKTIKNFSGLTLRIPHEIKGCSEKLIKPLTDGGMHNCLILSPPGCGKTTMLRDLCRSISEMSPKNNILLLDERSEIAAAVNGIPQLDVGNNVDVVSNCTKADGIIQGIRSMNPHIIVTDELAQKDDIEAVYTASCSGVYTVATVHASDQYDLMNKTSFDKVIKHRIFTRYAVLSDKPSVGTVSGIYDENFDKLY